MFKSVAVNRAVPVWCRGFFRNLLLARREVSQRCAWQSHLGDSSSLFVNAATWGLLVTGRLVATHSGVGLRAALRRVVGHGGEPLIRRGVNMALRLMGEQFVTGETIAQALANSWQREGEGFRYSHDMLGEAAMTAQDACAGSGAASQRWQPAARFGQQDEDDGDRGVGVDHVTVHRWAIKILPMLAAVFRRRKRLVDVSWRMNETCICRCGLILDPARAGRQAPSRTRSDQRHDRAGLDTAAMALHPTR